MDTIQFVDALLRFCPPDMTRVDDDEYRRPCYSLTRVDEILGGEVARATRLAFDGSPIWADCFRAFLIGGGMQGVKQ